jgi:hypothetical protein
VRRYLAFPNSNFTTLHCMSCSGDSGVVPKLVSRV